MKTNLTQAITIHSAYGVEVEYTDGEIFTVDSKIERYNEPLKKVSVFRAIHDIEQGKAKLLLHSLDKLTQEIDGKVGIVELLKIKHKSWFGRHYDDRYSETDIEICPAYIKAYVKYHAPHSIEVWLNEMENTPTWITNYLLANHYNVFGLSSEYFKEKSISKNNGSRDIGLVDMMDIDTY